MQTWMVHKSVPVCVGAPLSALSDLFTTPYLRIMTRRLHHALLISIVALLSIAATGAPRKSKSRKGKARSTSVVKVMPHFHLSCIPFFDFNASSRYWELDAPANIRSLAEVSSMDGDLNSDDTMETTYLFDENGRIAGGDSGWIDAAGGYTYTVTYTPAGLLNTAEITYTAPSQDGDANIEVVAAYTFGYEGDQLKTIREETKKVGGRAAKGVFTYTVTENATGKLVKCNERPECYVQYKKNGSIQKSSLYSYNMSFSNSGRCSAKWEQEANDFSDVTESSVPANAKIIRDSHGNWVEKSWEEDWGYTVKTGFLRKITYYK